MAIEDPYTTIPNAILDALPGMGNAEMRIVLAVCRQTFGWHKTEDAISITQFERLTGMTRANISHAIAQAVKNKRITRTARGQTSAYSATVIAAITVEGSTVITKIPELLSQRQQAVIAAIIDEPPTIIAPITELLSQQYPQKKEKERTTVKKLTVKKETAVPSSPHLPDPLFERLCFILYKHQNYKALTEKQRGLLNQQSKKLRDDVHASAEDLANWYKTIWRAEWPGNNGGAPQPGQVVAGVAAYITAPARKEDEDKESAEERRRKYTPVELSNWTTVTEA